MSIFPPSTNADYYGPKWAAWILMLVGAMEFIAGFIHYFLPDGGAGVIAGIDLSTRGDAIIRLFAWYGSVQIPHALLLFVIGLRYRTLIPLGLLAIIISRGLASWDGWFGKGSLSGHHPPEHYLSPLAVVLALVVLMFVLRAPSRGAAAA